jgi:retron-type reverse transcriptase
LIRKSLNAGYFLFNVFKEDMIETPQGSIISPILANIYLDQLDKKVDQIKESFDIGGNTPKYNPE